MKKQVVSNFTFEVVSTQNSTMLLNIVDFMISITKSNFQLINSSGEQSKIRRNGVMQSSRFYKHSKTTNITN